jgi:hypothetical protein
MHFTGADDEKPEQFAQSNSVRESVGTEFISADHLPNSFSFRLDM